MVQQTFGLSALSVSIHALTRRATGLISDSFAISRSVATHALTRRATAEDHRTPAEPIVVSIHALTRRATCPGCGAPRS